jgi:uncharacterized Zn finger protein (UPF0148 family)
MSPEAQPALQEKKPRYVCPGCTADQVFEPKDGTLTCPYCGRKERIPESPEEVEERSYEAYLKAENSRIAPIAPAAMEIRCDACGATTSAAPHDLKSRCPFCGRNNVHPPSPAQAGIAPNGVLPFYVTEDAARAAIRQWIASRWFAPGNLKALAAQQGIGGVYLPFWTYDTHTTTPYIGQRGEHYWVTETYTVTDANGKQVTQTRSVRRTRWHHCSGTVTEWFNDILIPATKAVASDRLATLEPWDLNQTKPYDAAYLSGYRAQRYEIDLQEGFDRAKAVMDPAIQGSIRADIGGDEQSITSYATSYMGITFKHILLPVYVGAYRFHETVYQVMVNARTGEVTGERPYSPWKIALLTIVILAAIALFLYAANQR